MPSPLDYDGELLRVNGSLMMVEVKDTFMPGYFYLGPDTNVYAITEEGLKYVGELSIEEGITHPEFERAEGGGFICSDTKIATWDNIEVVRHRDTYADLFIGA